jgi:PAS domain S-box-containing protein
LVANAPFLVATIDRDGAMLTINDAVERILGYQASELVSGRVAIEIHPDDRTRLRELFAQTAPAESGSVETRIRHRDGRWVRFRLEAINRGEHGPAAGMLLYGIPLEA